MGQTNIKCFAVFFAALVLLQNTYADVSVNFDENADERSKTETGSKDLVEIDTNEAREKRFWNGVVLLTTGVSAGLDIYKQEVGCKDITPDLDDNVKLINQKQRELVEMKDRINLRWVPVQEKERYLDRLDSHFGTLIKQIQKFDALQVDILTQIDPQILKKFDLVKANIENNLDRYNKTVLQDPSILVAKYFSAEQFAMLMSVKFGSIALYIGARVRKAYQTYQKLKAYQQYQRTARNIAGRARNNAVANLAETNPGLKFKIKFYARGKWASFKAKWPRTANVASKVTNIVKLPFTSRNPYWVGTKRFVASSAKAGVTLFTIVYEIWGFMKFNEKCHENLKRSEDMLRNMDEHKANMTRTLTNINKLESDLDQEFIKQKSNLTSKQFIALITEVISLGENSENETEADEITKATKNIQYYIDNIKNADYKKTYDLNSLLIKAFLSINYSLDCLRAKLSIIASVFQDCLAGTGHMASIYIKAKALEKRKIKKECITNGYFTYKDIVNVTAEAMKLYNASTVCIRNNKKILKLVCGDWYSNIKKNISANNHNITTEDVEYFIPLCEPGNVRGTVARVICSTKAEKVSSANVTKIYHKFNTTQVLAVYAKCNLTSSQEGKICDMKNDGYTSEQVIREFTLYPRDKVEAFYNSCTKAVNVVPGDGTTICQYKQFGITFTGHAMSSLWDTLMKKYGQKTIEAYMKKNCTKKAGDMVEKKDSKISANYHKSYGGVATTKLEDSNREFKSFDVDKHQDREREIESFDGNKQENQKRNDKQELLARLEKLLWN